MRRSRFRNKEAELDITSFMNLMIILVPVLLMNMVFSHISVLDLTLPDLASSSTPSDEPKKYALEIVIEDESILISGGPDGLPAPLKRLPKVEDEETGELVQDFETLATYLKDIKRQLRENDIDKKDILILSQQDTDYQTIVKAMDTVRSFPALQAASVVEAELFPVISLGDAPVDVSSPANQEKK